jgi:hypothetical protein
MLHQQPPPQNTILRSLPADALAILQPHLTHVRVKRRVILQEAHAPAEKVHFIESGMVAVLVRTHQDGPVQGADCECYRIIAAEYAPLAAKLSIFVE